MGHAADPVDISCGVDAAAAGLKITVYSNLLSVMIDTRLFQPLGKVGPAQSRYQYHVPA